VLVVVPRLGALWSSSGSPFAARLVGAHAGCRFLKLPAELAVLSDLDGTLVDSRASAEAAFRWWVAYRSLGEGALQSFPFGRKSEELVADLAPELDARAEGELLERRQAQDTEGVVAVAGAAELLHEHSRLVIATSGTLELARARLARAGLAVPPRILTAEDWERGKPDPEPYLKAAERLGAEPSECLVLEDSPPGVQSAVAAGIPVIAILTSYTVEELPGAVAYLDSLVGLAQTVAQLGLGARPAR
jgi:sugar-phosphatase